MKVRAIAALALLSLLPMAPAAATTPPPPVVVSLTFDDGLAEQWSLLEQVRTAGYRATMYVHGDKIGGWHRLTAADLHRFRYYGFEIGGHTRTHPDLTTLTEAQVRDEVCGDRTKLIQYNFAPTTFAYPYGRQNTMVQRIVKECGYTAARITAGLPAGATETIPPLNRYTIRAHGSVESTDTATDLLAHADQARTNGGGWVNYIFHNLCPNDDPHCTLYGITPQTMADLLTGLKARGVTVKTVHDVVAY